MNTCTAKVKLDDGEIIRCNRSVHEDDVHQSGWTEFKKIDDETFAVRRFDLESYGDPA